MKGRCGWLTVAVAASAVGALLLGASAAVAAAVEEQRLVEAYSPVLMLREQGDPDDVERTRF